MKTFIASGTGSQQSLQNIQNEKVPVYDTISDAQSDLANLEEGQIIATKENTAVSQLLDALYPIGVTYLQFPTCESPVNLFPTLTWTEINFDGAFFRASGTNADAFIGVGGTLIPQGDQYKAHSHTRGTMNITGSYLEAGVVQSTAGAFYETVETWAQPVYGTNTCNRVNFDASRSWSGSTSSEGGTETRPINYTVKVWKRTA